MTQSAHAYAYLRPSAVLDGADGRRLDLATSGGATPLGAAANRRFFAGYRGTSSRGEGEGGSRSAAGSRQRTGFRRQLSANRC